MPGVEVVDARGRAAIETAVAGADGLLCLLTDRVDDALLARAPALRVVANVAVGVDNIDVAACTRRRVCVANTPDVLTDATADLAWALLLAAARRLVEGDTLVRGGGWTGWSPTQLLGADVHGKTLGVIGFGRIGRAVARRARGFDMRVLYAAPRRAPETLERELGATWRPLDALLAESDFVSLHCPLTDATRGLIGAAQLERMKPTAILVNTARGACVDEAALAGALARGRLAGAGLDVFADEPRVHERLRASPRAAFAPHIGSATIGARARMVELAATAAAAVLAGGRPRNLVNPEVLPA
jgi:glyoxylate reductase